MLRYVRLAPLSSTLALEASLGRDLSTVQNAIIAARADLARLHLSKTPKDPAPQHAVQDVVDEALGEVLAKHAGPLGKPRISELLESKSVRNWHRPPEIGEILILSKGRPHLHALREPFLASDSDMNALMVQISEANAAISWCGWKFHGKVARLTPWDPETLSKWPQCLRCFGQISNHVGPKEASSSSESSSNEDV